MRAHARENYDHELDRSTRAIHHGQYLPPHIYKVIKQLNVELTFWISQALGFIIGRYVFHNRLTSPSQYYIRHTCNHIISTWLQEYIVYTLDGYYPMT